MTRLFGTNGIRGVVGQEMTTSLALDVGRAIGTILHGGSVAVGNDTRLSGAMLKAAVISGLTSTGCSVVDVGTAPSPSIQHYVKTHKVGGGVIITASHNPREYNGIKALDARGMEASKEDEERIEDVYFSRAFSEGTWNSVGTVGVVDDCNQAYLGAILKHVDTALVRELRFKVVLDCGNGASCFTSPYLLDRLGCQVATLNAQPDGTFPGHPPEPREEHIRELMQMVVDTRADLGVAHDGDADRVLFVDEKGRYVEGDRSLALVAGYMVRKMGGGTVVTPVSSSSVVEEIVQASGGHILYTKVGAPLVARRMYEEEAVFGGEENGGLIFPKHQFCRDGAMGLAVVLELMAAEKASLSELLSVVPSYHLVKSSVPCPPELRDRVMEALIPRLRGERIETVDGLKVYREGGWVLVRPSGTEAIFRVFSEGGTLKEAKGLNKWAVSVLDEVVGGLGESP